MIALETFRGETQSVLFDGEKIGYLTDGTLLTLVQLSQSEQRMIKSELGCDIKMPLEPPESWYDR